MFVSRFKQILFVRSVKHRRMNTVIDNTLKEKNPLYGRPRLSREERKATNKKRRQQKKMERKVEFLEDLEQPHIFIHAG